MEKIWLQHYPPGVPFAIDPDVYPSIPAFFLACAERFSDRFALSHLGYRITYGEMAEHARKVAGFFQQLGLKKGDSVALMMPNLLQFPIVMLGALMAGLIVVNVNPLYTVSELTHQLNDAKPKAIVVFELFAVTVEKALPDVAPLSVIITRLGDFFLRMRGFFYNVILKYVKRAVRSYHLPNAIFLSHALRSPAVFAPVSIMNHDIAFLQYTGGTTGVAKGAMLSHRNVLANIEQVYAWIQGKFCAGQEILLTALPLYHIFSLVVNGLLFCKLGAMSVLITNPRDVKSIVREMKRYPFTAITGVNVLFNALLSEPSFSTVNLSQLKLSLGGGAPVQKAVAVRWQQRTGQPLLAGYGLTETSPAVTVNAMDLTQYDGTAGLPLPSTEIKIMATTEKECALGEVGELVVKGPQVMQGYFQNEAETHAVLKEGWLWTGDLAVLDTQGRVTIVGRKKEMILVSGFNVYPSEIENVIMQDRRVKEVAVIGAPDDVQGEKVKAFIVKQDSTLTAEDVMQHCQQFLTGYKRPKEIVFVDALPKSTVGKILHRALK